MEGQRGFKLLNVFTGIFVAVLVVVPPLGSKLIAIGPLVIPGGTLVIPLTFIINGVLTEVYGFERSRRLIWIGMGCQFFAALMFWLVGIWPEAPAEQKQDAYLAILGVVPRITLGSFAAYFLGEFLKSAMMSKMKFAQGGRLGWLQTWRFVASSLVGEFVDSVVFIFIAYGGTQPIADLVKIVLAIWVIKVGYEVVALPLSIWVANRVKAVEGIDRIDRPEETNYNPFASFLKWD